MSKKSFDYSVSTIADNHAFYSACEKIENIISDIIEKKELLIDVDGSLVQTYKTKHGEITVQNDYEVDAVYIISDFRLDKLGYPYTLQKDMPLATPLVKGKKCHKEVPGFCENPFCLK